ncbi:MAG: hypothetical protein ABIU29_07860, partial [Chthoniobacterales bacterium]
MEKYFTGGTREAIRLAGFRGGMGSIHSSPESMAEASLDLETGERAAECLVGLPKPGRVGCCHVSLDLSIRCYFARRQGPEAFHEFRFFSADAKPASLIP